MPDHAALKNTCGTGLLNLPAEILQGIARHFEAAEWAKGPSRTCHFLRAMYLPRLVLSIREYEAVPHWDSWSCTGKDVEDSCCEVSERTLSALKWIAARMRPGTSTLSINFRALQATARHGKEAALMQAFKGHAHLTQLKCLEILQHTPYGWGHVVVALFSDWLLRRVPGLRALNLAAGSWPSIGGKTRFEHLQHLQLGAGSLYDCQLQFAVQLPQLQTLCVDGGSVPAIANIDVADCHQLRQLALKGLIVEALHRQPDCQLDIDLGCAGDSLHALLTGPMGPHISAAKSIHCVMLAGDLVPNSVQGLLGTLPTLQTLRVSWFYVTPEYWKGGASNIEAHPPLMSLMPSVGPVCNLKVIIITGVNMKCTVPAGLPNLEELVIWMMNSLELSFEDPGATSKVLTKFYAYATILDMNKRNMQQMSKHFGTAGLTLSAVVAPADGTVREFAGCCIFVKPASAADPLMEEVFATAHRLSHACRCGACFDCLRTAGCVD